MEHMGDLEETLSLLRRWLRLQEKYQVCVRDAGGWRVCACESVWVCVLVDVLRDEAALSCHIISLLHWLLLSLVVVVD